MDIWIFGYLDIWQNTQKDTQKRNLQQPKATTAKTEQSPKTLCIFAHG